MSDQTKPPQSFAPPPDPSVDVQTPTPRPSSQTETSSDLDPPVLSIEGSAYPEPPPVYELSPASPVASPHHDPALEPPVPHLTPVLPPPETLPPSRSAAPAYPEAPIAYESDPGLDPVAAAREADRAARSGDAVPAAAPVSQPAPPPALPYMAATPPVSGSPYDPPRRRANLPLIVGLIILFAALLIGLAYYFFHVDGRSVRAGGALSTTAAGLEYSNAREHVAFTAPATWSNYPTSTAQVMVRGDGCSFGLLEQRTLLSANSLANAESRDMRRRHPDADPIITPRTVAGHDGLTFTGTYTDSEGEPMSQTYILLNRGSTMFTLIETSTAPACRDAFSSLEESLRI